MAAKLPYISRKRVDLLEVVLISSFDPLFLPFDLTSFHVVSRPFEPIRRDGTHQISGSRDHQYGCERKNKKQLAREQDTNEIGPQNKD